MCYGLCLCLLCAVVPPGYYYNGTVTLKCPSGSYRADWKPATDATVGSCISCGVGVQASLTDQIKVYNDSLGGVIYWFEPVTTSADDCCKYHAALHWLHPIPTLSEFVALEIPVCQSLDLAPKLSCLAAWVPWR